MTPSFYHSTQVVVAMHRVAEVQAVLVVAIPTVTVGVGVKDVLITDQSEVDTEKRGVRVTIVSSFTHQLHPPGQAGVGGGGTERATGTTLTRDLVVGTDEGTSYTKDSKSDFIQTRIVIFYMYTIYTRKYLVVK